MLLSKAHQRKSCAKIHEGFIARSRVVTREHAIELRAPADAGCVSLPYIIDEPTATAFYLLLGYPSLASFRLGTSRVNRVSALE